MHINSRFWVPLHLCSDGFDLRGNEKIVMKYKRTVCIVVVKPSAIGEYTLVIP